MPVYTYRCDNCGIQFDHQQKFSDPVLSKCPECGKKSLRKVYTPVGIVFKGSGFYATDHRSPSGGGSVHGSSSKTEERSAESKAETKTESKAQATAAKMSSGGESK